MVETSVVSLMISENGVVAKSSLRIWWKCGAQAFLMIHFVFVHLHLKWRAVGESGQIFGSRSEKWSITLKDRLCSAKNIAILISASFTSLSFCLPTNILSIVCTGLGSWSSSSFCWWLAESLCFLSSVITALSSFEHILQRAFSAFPFTGSSHPLKLSSFSQALRYFWTYECFC